MARTTDQNITSKKVEISGDTYNTNNENIPIDGITTNSSSTTTINNNTNINTPNDLSLILSNLNKPISNPYNSEYIKNEQLLKLIMQYLNDVGFTSISNQLSNLTGLTLDDPLVLNFINLINHGDWDNAESLIPQLSLKNQLILRYLIRKQNFLESLLIENNNKKALAILRGHITHLNPPQTEIKLLSSLLMNKNDSDNLKNLNWPINNNNGLENLNNLEKNKLLSLTRNTLVVSISDYISPNKLLPQNRLLKLVDQALNYQRLGDPFFIPKPNKLNINSSSKDTSTGVSPDNNDDEHERFTLYRNIKSSINDFPNKLRYTLNDHTSECWYIKYSNNGKYLATTSKDNSIIIYSVNDNYKKITTLVGHKNAVIYCSWSNDNSRLISTSIDLTIKIWDLKDILNIDSDSNITDSKKITNSFDKLKSATSTTSNNNTITSTTTNNGISIGTKPIFSFSIGNSGDIRVCSLEYLPNGKGFIAGSPNKQLILFNNNGTAIFDFEIKMRVLDVSITPDSSKLLVITQSKELMIFDLINSDHKLLHVVNIGKNIASITTNRNDSNHCLITVGLEELQLWNINSNPPYLVQKYYGYFRSHFVIRSCFTDNHIISGSLNGACYIWNRNFGNLIDIVDSHDSLVNCVDWKPIDPNSDSNTYEWASCADDGTVKIWGYPLNNSE
ncbi:unnamed protein product [[Candida] boidinii]|uniref:Unnamed protein product n=1 Tax=Candida boidinii TaxID=5477 RepID=A0A9W6SXQ0_CANBO|nr:hypothetical protein B5S30_g5081 [[Candida] boidinii]GME69333.1 unnamed protein product [[Candida] boidinii]